AGCDATFQGAAMAGAPAIGVPDAATGAGDSARPGEGSAVGVSLGRLRSPNQCDGCVSRVTAGAASSVAARCGAVVASRRTSSGYSSEHARITGEAAAAVSLRAQSTASR